MSSAAIMVLGKLLLTFGGPIAFAPWERFRLRR